MVPLARTPEGAELTRQHRTAQLALRAALVREVAQLWPLWDPFEIASYGRFVQVAGTLVRGRNRESSGLAGRYFREFRRAEGTGGNSSPRPAEPPGEDEIARSLRATGLSGALRASRAGFSREAASRSGLVQATGSASRLVLAGGRDTITQSTRADERALGWARVTDADPCHFCAMIAGRGPVFTAATVTFRAHDHCACVPEPTYEGSDWPGRGREFESLWQRATRGLSGDEARRAFRRAHEGRADPDDPINAEE